VQPTGTPVPGRTPGSGPAATASTTPTAAPGPAPGREAGPSAGPPSAPGPAATSYPLTFTVTADNLTPVAGGTVRYTVTAVNSTALPALLATFSVSLPGVLDDATYNNDATATAGATSFVSPSLGWSGTVPANGIVTVAYSVTVKNPDPGDMTMSTTVTSLALTSNCFLLPSDPRCSVTANVAGLRLVNTASVTTAIPGQTVRFTATFTNTGQVPYTGISIALDMAGVLDDAADDNDESATAGTLALSASGPAWTGNIPVGAAVTATGTVTVARPDPGDRLLTAVLVSSAVGGNCPAGSADPRCAASVPVLVPVLAIATTASPGTASPGLPVTFTTTITNSGQTAYIAAVVTADLTGILDDAAYNRDATATSGTLLYLSPTLIWTGNLAVGASATITYSATVSDPETGDLVLRNAVTSILAGSTCPPAAPAAGCTVTVPVVRGSLAISVPGIASLGSAAPGDVVSGNLGIVQVLDGRAVAGAAWTVAVSGSDFRNATVPAAAAIVSGNARYVMAAPATTGTATFASVPLTALSLAGQGVVTAINANGSTTATWNPVIMITIPAAAIAGTYSATIVHSVT
jgi:hypothetical protein